MKILLLAAGKGERFTSNGFPPKPLIDINGVPMWEYTLNNFLSHIPHNNYEVIIATKSEYGITNDKYNVVNLEGQQYGATWSAIKALEQLADCNDDLIILNIDQVIKFDWKKFEEAIDSSNGDSNVLFHFIEPENEYKWGRSAIDLQQYKVSAIVEKIPISNYAHTGHYHFSSVSKFIHYANKLISLDIKVNGEYFLSPIYNLMIADGEVINPFFVDQFIPFGIPDDLNSYLAFERSRK